MHRNPEIQRLGAQKSIFFIAKGWVKLRVQHKGQKLSINKIQDILLVYEFQRLWDRFWVKMKI